MQHRHIRRPGMAGRNRSLKSAPLLTPRMWRITFVLGHAEWLSPVLLGIKKILLPAGLTWEGIFRAQLLYWIRMASTKQGLEPWCPISQQSLPLLLLQTHSFCTFPEIFWRRYKEKPCCSPVHTQKYAVQLSGESIHARKVGSYPFSQWRTNKCNIMSCMKAAFIYIPRQKKGSEEGS